MTGPKTAVFGVGRLLTTKILVNVILPVLVTVPVNTSKPPSTAGVSGQALVTLICGVVTKGQVVVTLLLTALLLQRFSPVAVRVELAEQASKGATKLLLKPAVAPGASEPKLNTTVFGAGWLLTTLIFVKIMFPALLTLPPYMTRLPGVPGLTGQVCLTEMSAVVTNGQSMETLAPTPNPAHCSLPLTLTEVVIEQALLAGTV